MTFEQFENLQEKNYLLNKVKADRDRFEGQMKGLPFEVYLKEEYLPEGFKDAYLANIDREISKLTKEFEDA